jgi:hypothetical protein
LYFLFQQTTDGETYFLWPKKDDTDKVHPTAVFYGPLELIGIGDPFQVRNLQAITLKFKDTR